MLKLIITIALLYFAYRLFFERPGLQEPFRRRFIRRDEKPDGPEPKRYDYGDDYVDYEEVDKDK